MAAPPIAPTLHAQRRGTAYSALLCEVRAAGLLERRPGSYLLRLVTIAVLLAAGGFALLWLGDSRWQLAVAAYSGVVVAQLAFLGHDAGHQQISCVRRRNDAFGTLVATLGVGLSYYWWVDKHNRHHRHPNRVGSDPDVAPGVLAWTDEQAADQRGVLRLIARHQAGLFFPLLLLEGWNLRVASALALRHTHRQRRTEVALLVVHVVVGLTVLLLVLSPVRALEFVLIQQAVLGVYIGVSFAPNHKGMPMIEPGSQLGFAERQVITSRNVSGGRLVAAMFGGLNYQIEHHLFPSMPRRNLARCQPMVRRFCAANALPYTQTSLLTSYSLSLRYLRRLSPPPRAVPLAATRSVS